MGKGIGQSRRGGDRGRRAALGGSLLRRDDGETKIKIIKISEKSKVSVGKFSFSIST